jgi:hypothetical protein
MGFSALQGPHHSAQKSMTTGVRLEPSRTISWKLEASTSYAKLPMSCSQFLPMRLASSAPLPV